MIVRRASVSRNNVGIEIGFSDSKSPERPFRKSVQIRSMAARSLTEGSGGSGGTVLWGVIVGTGVIMSEATASLKSGVFCSVSAACSRGEPGADRRSKEHMLAATAGLRELWQLPGSVRAK